MLKGLIVWGKKKMKMEAKILSSSKELLPKSMNSTCYSRHYCCCLLSFHFALCFALFCRMEFLLVSLPPSPIPEHLSKQNKKLLPYESARCRSFMDQLCTYSEKSVGRRFPNFCSRRKKFPKLTAIFLSPDLFPRMNIPVHNFSFFLHLLMGVALILPHREKKSKLVSPNVQIVLQQFGSLMWEDCLVLVTLIDSNGAGEFGPGTATFAESASH